MMYTSEMTVLAATHLLHEVLVSNRFWLLPDLMMVWIVNKLTVDFLFSQDEEYKELFQAMIDFRRQLPVHDRTFLNLFADQNIPRRDCSGWVHCVQVEGVESSLVLGTYGSVLNDMVDQLLACTDSGQMSDSPVVGELLATLTQHGMAQGRSGTCKSFHERRRLYLEERELPAATSAASVAEYVEASRTPHYVIPSPSESRRAADAALEDAPAAQRLRRE
eukprot:contig_9112_g2169